MKGATTMPGSRAASSAPNSGNREPRADVGTARPGRCEKSTSYELPGRAGEIVGQRTSLAGEVRRALIVPLVEGAAGLVQEILRGPQRFLLGRLHRAPFELAHGPGDVADALPRALEQPLLFRGWHLRPQCARRGGCAGL